MIPHSFSIDSQSKSADLASTILSAASLPQISAAVSAVDSHLHSLSPDQSRHFFSITFPTLICKLFGFADSSSSSSSSSPSKPSPPPPGWIDAASADSDLSGKLFNLLSPSGVLMSSISSVDRLGLVRYMFPAERLPDWLRFAISGERDCQAVSDLCPMLRGRVKGEQVKGRFVFQVQLNVFEYYVFWFAYYPVCKGSNESESSASVSVPKSRKFGLENWTSSLPVFSGGARRGSDQKPEPNLYTRLLYAYLRTFVPMIDADANVKAYQPFSSSLLHYSNSVDDSVALRAEFFVSALVHYWLVDNDFSPLPVSVRKSFGLSAPFRSVLGDVPPVAGLGEVVSLLVRYLSVCSIVASKVPELAQFGGSPRWRKSGLTDDTVKSLETTSLSTSLSSAGPWNLWMQRPLYRFILRTFLFCPVGTSMKNISGVVSVWIAYIEPWKLSKEDFLELDLMMGSSNKISENGGQSKGREYSSAWLDYVLSNYLYYTSLVMHFIGFAHKFLHTNPELVIQMVAKIINVLTCSKELLDLIKNVDTVFHSRQAGSCKSALHSLYKFVTPIRDQLQDWEDGLCENVADGSFLHDNWNNDLQLFSDGEDGGQQLLQLFILRAESELQAISADPSSLQNIDLLKSQLCCLFGDHALKQSPSAPDKSPCQQSRDEIFMPRRVGNRSFAKYKGDWIRRPISDDEVAWLAKLLIHLSIYLNESLGLNQVSIHENPTWSYVEITRDRGDDEHGPNVSFKIILSSLISWLLMLKLVVVKSMVKHGLKINLRIFASKKFVMLLLLFLVFALLRKGFRMICNLF